MFAAKVTGLIKRRYSCRSYRDEPLAESDRYEIKKFLSGKNTGPFGTAPGFTLLAAEPGDSGSMKELGTYGFIRNPAAFVAGYISEAGMELEDYGYCMEKIILKLTDMGLGSCWIGGSFRKSGFAKRAGIKSGEIIPAVAATGYIAERETLTDRLVKAGAGSKKRKPWHELFFDGRLEPLHLPQGAPYAEVLEMVRLAPSASNKQPWRIINDSTGIFHLFMERTPRYTGTNRLLGLADLQRIDMGIAMCHFELTASEKKLHGKWTQKNKKIKTPGGWEYISTWNEK